MQASMQTSRTASFAPLRSRVRRSGAVRTRAAAAPVTWGNRSCHNGAHLSKERKAELEKVCEHIAQRGKGITACDEGPGARPRLSGPGARKCRDAQPARRNRQVRTTHAGQAVVGSFLALGSRTSRLALHAYPSPACAAGRAHRAATPAPRCYVATSRCADFPVRFRHDRGPLCEGPLQRLRHSCLCAARLLAPVPPSRRAIALALAFPRLTRRCCALAGWHHKQRGKPARVSPDAV